MFPFFALFCTHIFTRQTHPARKSAPRKLKHKDDTHWRQKWIDILTVISNKFKVLSVQLHYPKNLKGTTQRVHTLYLYSVAPEFRCVSLRTKCIKIFIYILIFYNAHHTVHSAFSKCQDIYVILSRALTCKMIYNSRFNRP